MAHILVVEDEPGIASFIKKGLTNKGYDTTVVDHGQDAIREALTGQYDLMILDIGLPDIDGFEVLEQVRGQGMKFPIIVLTARSSVNDTVAGLESGADDYMPKPYRFEELLARIRLRLRQAHSTDSSGVTLLSVGGLRLDLRTRRVTVDGKAIDLPMREFTMLQIFMENPDQVISREQFLDEVWGNQADPTSNVVDVYVAYLRRKIGDKYIATVRGMGYRLVVK